MTPDTTELYDVLSVSIATGKVTGLMGEGKTRRDAEAIINMAVMRRGVGKEFYAEVPHGLLKVGEEYRP